MEGKTIAYNLLYSFILLYNIPLTKFHPQNTVSISLKGNRREHYLSKKNKKQFSQDYNIDFDFVSSNYRNSYMGLEALREV